MNTYASILYPMSIHLSTTSNGILVVQIQAIGLQVLKSIAQRSNNVENNSFLMFFSGELFGDIFAIIRKMLKVFIVNT